MTIGKKYRFDAAHFLPGHPKCGVLHGHTWTITIELEEVLPDPNIDLLLDFHDLDVMVNLALHRLDHAVLNNIPGLEYPTCERVARWIKARINFPNMRTIVIVQEGGGGYART